MFKIISIILQALVLKNSFNKSVSALDNIEKTVDKVRGYAVFTIGCIMGCFFLMMALIVAVISIGLQIQNTGSVSFTGLMISSAIFLIISAFIFIMSFIILAVQKNKIEQKMLEKERLASSSSVGNLVEEILKQILVNLAKPSSNDSNDRSSQAASQHNNQ
ncbi:MAG: hypothetical protein ACK41T_01905 [Pseudobdellovibrio sp.]